MKVLISGTSGAGKTTLLKDLKDTFVVAHDGKNFPLKIPHINVEAFPSVSSLIDLIAEKLEAYNDKYKRYPDVIVFDTVSRILATIISNCELKHVGFAVWTEANKEINKFVGFINDLVNSDFFVIMCTHALYDVDMRKYVEIAQGTFAKIGGFMSTVDEAVFIEVKNNKRQLYFKNPLYLSKTMLDLPDVMDSSEFDINEYVKMIKERIADNKDCEL